MEQHPGAEEEPPSGAKSKMHSVYETRSEVLSAGSSKRSSASAATKFRAKAEAARVRVKFAEQEASIMRQKAMMEAELHVLQQHKEATAASREAEVYEAAADMEVYQRDLIEMKEEDAAQRTRDYVDRHSLEEHALQNLPDSQMQSTPINTATQQLTQQLQQMHLTPINTAATQQSTQQLQQTQAAPINTAIQLSTQQLHPNHRQEYSALRSTHANNAPMVTNRMSHNQDDASSIHQHALQTSQNTDLVRYLSRREIVNSGLLEFDDRPENYWAWKSSFQHLTRELCLTSREELDLLVRWLGPESSLQAKRIRAAHVHNPEAGVQMIQQRLEDCYGSPEVIEHALLKKIENFPRITNKEAQKLMELGDILLEVEAAKSSGSLPGLAYLDTAMGVNPIIEKLPYGLQERWIVQGSRYKEENRVSFPPFGFFVRFINNQAKIRNDPSFAFTMSSGLRPEPPGWNARKTPVTVRKTEVTSPNPTIAANAESRKQEPDKHCPIHSLPHPLSRCRGFRLKSIEDRKTYLKENHICFQCCASTAHIAKDCKATVKCRECDSERHISALHPGPAPWLTEVPPTQSEYGGESDTNEEITAKCTDICNKAPRPRSCAKISLVSVYPANNPDKAHQIYVVLDDQSNRSLAKPEFFNLFNIRGEVTSYTLKTCSGVTETAGRKANDFVMESLDKKTRVALPSLIECSRIPDDKSEIPTPEITKHFPHLRPLIGKIPPLEPKAPILLLLGRDILSVHKVREQRNGPNNTPYAQRLDMGWVVVGEVCLGRVHKPASVNVYKTNVLPKRRAPFLSPCSNIICPKEKHEFSALQPFNPKRCLKSTVTHKTTGNEDLGNTPLPFPQPRRSLPKHKEEQWNCVPSGQNPADHGTRSAPKIRLTHEVLTTLMAKVMAMMNNRPLVPVSSNLEVPKVLSPARLLTQKASVTPAPPGDFELGCLYKSQWKQVQSLADAFWKKWRQEPTLQTRRIWEVDKPNLQERDIVLLKDTQVKPKAQCYSKDNQARNRKGILTPSQGEVILLLHDKGQ